MDKLRIDLWSRGVLGRLRRAKLFDQSESIEEPCCSLRKAFSTSNASKSLAVSSQRQCLSLLFTLEQRVLSVGAALVGIRKLLKYLVSPLAILRSREGWSTLSS